MYEGSYLIYVICVCLGMVVSITYCVAFLLCLSTTCVPYFDSFSGLSILIAPSIFFFLLNRELRDSRFPSILNSYYTSECKCEIVCKDVSAFLTLSRQKTWRPLVIIASKTNYMKLPSICLAGQNKTCEVLYRNSSFLMEPIPWPPLPFVKILYDVFETHYKDSSFLLIG